MLGMVLLLVSLGAPAAQDDWPTNGGDLFNRRYAPLAQIDRHNVSGMKAVWRVRLGGSGMGPHYSGESQPLYLDGALSISTGANDVFAIDVQSGDILWSHRAQLAPNNAVICCGWTSRGVASGERRIYAGQLDGKLIALDMQSGSMLWSIQAKRPEQGFTIREFGTRGRIKAFSAKDGSLVWTFYTVPAPGELGHHTWPAKSDAWQRGGGSIWQTPAIDEQLGLLYFSTGNAGPDIDAAGCGTRSRKPAKPAGFASSIAAMANPSSASRSARLHRSRARKHRRRSHFRVATRSCRNRSR